MIVVAAAVVLAAALLVAGWGVLHRQADRALRGRVRESVIVTLKTGEAFAGVLFEADERSLVLVQATEATEGLAVDGELLLRWAEVAYVQKP